MKMRKFSMKKKLVAAGIVATSVASAFGAYAYWSTSGTGSGSGGVGSGYTTATDGGYSSAYSTPSASMQTPSGWSSPDTATAQLARSPVTPETLRLATRGRMGRWTCL